MTFSAWISNGCFASGVGASVPVTMTAAPTFSFCTSSKLESVSEKTTCNGSKNVPSFTTINPNALELRMLLTHPPTVIFLFSYASLLRNKSLIFVSSIFLPPTAILFFRCCFRLGDVLSRSCLFGTLFRRIVSYVCVFDHTVQCLVA